MSRDRKFSTEGVRLGLAARSAPEGENFGLRGHKKVARPEKDISDHTSSGPVRGYTKLASAASAFNFDFRGKTVLDIGSSTGGFTKYALDHGALKVIAVEKGTNQMMAPLRFDSRIDLHEKTDIFDFVINNEINVVVADVSFISITKILTHIKKQLNKNTDLLIMMKPQFEAKPVELYKGVVKNETIRRDIIKRFEFWLKQNNFVITKKHDNDLKGKTGNIERFYWLKIQ